MLSRLMSWLAAGAMLVALSGCHNGAATGDRTVVTERLLSVSPGRTRVAFLTQPKAAPAGGWITPFPRVALLDDAGWDEAELLARDAELLE